MAIVPITSWQIDGQTIETVTDFIFLGSKITADGDCSNETKRHLLLGRKAMTNLDSVLKSRESVLMRWMKLEPIIQSEVSQQETPIPYTNTPVFNLERWKQ